MKQKLSLPVTIVKYLFFISTLALIALAIGSFMRVGASPEMKTIYIVYAVLMFGDAMAMLVCGLYISRHIRLVYWFAVIVLCLNIILTIFDQFGLVDLLFLLFNIVTLVPLLVLRREFLPQ